MEKRKRSKMLSVRVSEEELLRVQTVADEICRRNRYATMADVLREMIGLESTGIVTAEHRRRLAFPLPEIAVTEQHDRLNPTPDDDLSGQTAQIIASLSVPHRG